MADFLEDLRSSKTDPDASVYDALSLVDRARLAAVWKRLQEVRAIKVKGNSVKSRSLRGGVANHTGRLFERLVRILLDDCLVLRHRGNVRSTVAEIDFLMEYGPSAAIVPMFRDAGTHSLGEAKCVNGALKTEWVTEFAGLLPLHGCVVGILFSAAPSKKLGSSCRHAISLLSAQGIRIVPFGILQMEKVIAGENFLKVLSEQYVKVRAMSTDISI